jgi:hypothetical protein
VVASLVVDECTGGRWPYLKFMCYGTYPLGVRYRVTMQRPADPS